VEDFERNLDAETFRLGCCPIVNLYKQRAEPIRWNHSEYEYRIIPDARRPAAHEIYSVNRVVGTTPANDEIEFHPFYSVKHGRDAKAPIGNWHARRQRSSYAGGQVDYGTEMYLSLVDLNFNPAELGDWTVDVETTCLNRDLPGRLPFGGGQPKLQFVGQASLARATCLVPPTKTFRPALRHGTLWRLISHLTLNHISLSEGEDGADALREILKLYDITNSESNAAAIAGLRGVSSRRVVGRVGGQVAAGFCRGVEISLHFDEERFRGSGVYLFSSVLERFLGLYASLNSFTKTIVTTTKRNGTLAQWRPRAGEQVLV
jgi:type VI secretion system protein ImpG